MSEVDFFKNILTQNLAAIVMALIFIWYLCKRDKINTKRDEDINETFKEFNTTIQNHLSHALKSEVKVSNSLSKLADYIKKAINNNKK